MPSLRHFASRSALSVSALMLAIAAIPAGAQAPVQADMQAAVRVRPLSWTDWADLSLAAPVVIRATVNRVDRLSRREAPDVPAGEVRALVRANLSAALKAPSVLPAEAAWRWQGAADSRGRPPFAKDAADVLVFASPLSGGADPAVQPLTLVGPAGQQPWDAAADAMVRDILRQALVPGATGLMVTGVRDAFHSDGEVEGAAESQFFLRTEGGAPLTLVVTRAPGRTSEVRVATGELVDRAQPVQPRTLLWRGLACGMPAQLPQALADTSELQRDWALARTRIGPCGRTLPQGG